MRGLLELGILQLGEVLFPGMRVALRVVEERHRSVLDQCVEHHKPCGGLYVGATPDLRLALPGRVGTVAEVLRVDRARDDSLAVTLLGLGRFRLVALNEHPQSLCAKVQLVDDGDDSDACHHLAAKVVAAFAAYLAALMTLADRPVAEITLPSDCAALSYFIAASLQIKPEEHQALLEADSIEDRLRQELLIVERERALLGKKIADTPSNPLFPDPLSRN